MGAQASVWVTLGDILLILALSGLIIPALQRARVSPVLGYLLGGLLLGPYGLGVFTDSFPEFSAVVITDTELIHTLAELGVVFLLFMIGLELTFSRLWELRKYVLGLGSFQIIITGFIIFLIALQFDNALPTSILIGAAFALSSTAIIMQLLTQWHLMSLPVGRVCFSVLLMQDLAVVPILVLIGAFAGYSEGSMLFLVFKALLVAFLVIAVIFVSGKLFLRPTLRLLSPAQNAEWLFAIILFLVLGCASLTQFFGLSAALGAFLAGLLLAETEYRHEIEVIIEPIKGVLLGIFFMSVGMSTDISAILEHPYWLFASITGIFLIKAVIFFPIALLYKVPKAYAAHAAVLLAPCGEFAFIIIGLALAGGLLKQADAQFFLLVASVSLLLTPLTSKFAPVVAWLVEGKNRRPLEDTFLVAGNEENNVIIAGFGRVGQLLANILESQGVPYIALDKDGAHVSRMRSIGYPVIVGNAHHVELWQKLGIEKSKAAVITIDDFSMTGNILKALRRKWPVVPIIVRVKDTLSLDDYYEAGASIVVPEALESSLQLARILLESTGATAQEADSVVDKHRQEILSGEGAEIRG